MIHLELIPIWAWLGFFVLAGALIAMRVVNRRQIAAQQAEMLARRRQNIAEYKAWRWVFGRPKTLQISDNSASKPKKD